jgi:SAM-dependent methyltransferase
MEDPKVLDRMRADWNQRAAEDAYYYVAFAHREQGAEEFFLSGVHIVDRLALELKRLRSKDSALEIGCGPGRLMRPLSRYFTEIHGVDVSDQMIHLAEDLLRDTPNAHPHHNSGSDLRLFSDDKFDFVYSYAVFQHIPSAEVVYNYLREARRVLKEGGILRCQVNGLPRGAKPCDTWSGVRFSSGELAQFAREQDLQLLALEEVSTPYMWITCRKRAAGWQASLQNRKVAKRAVIQRINNTLTAEPAAPASGALAALSLLMEGLPKDACLHNLKVTADGNPCRVIFIGERQADGVAQVNVALPEGVRTGLVPVEVTWLGQPLCDAGWVHILPAPPAAPRIASVTDGINLLAGARVQTRVVKVTMYDVVDASAFRAQVDGMDGSEIESLCADPVTQRYEFNFRLPERIGAGQHTVTVSLGKRTFVPVPIEVA